MVYQSEVQVGNKTVTSAQYLYLLTAAATKVNNGNKSSTVLKNVSYPPTPSETVTERKIPPRHSIS